MASSSGARVAGQQEGYRLLLPGILQEAGPRPVFWESVDYQDFNSASWWFNSASTQRAYSMTLAGER